HGVEPYGAANANGDSTGTTADTDENEGIELNVAKKSSVLYILMLFFFFVTSIASFSIHIPKHLENIGFDIKFSGNVMSAFIIGILAIGTLIMTSESKILIAIAVGIFGLVSSSIGIIAPALTTSLFGKRNYSEIYSTASMGLAISSIIALPAYGFVYDLFHSYTPVLYVIIIMLAINIVGVWLAFANQKKMVAQGLWKQ